MILGVSPPAWYPSASPRPAMAQQRSSSRGVLATILPILVGLLVIGAALFAVTAFLWPGFLRPAPPRINDPMALLPADSNWIVGADLAQARQQGILEPMLSFL